MGLNKGVHNDHRPNAAPRPVDLSMGQIWRARRAEVIILGRYERPRRSVPGCGTAMGLPDALQLPNLGLEPCRLWKQNVVLEMYVFVKIAFERFEFLQADAIGRARTVRDGKVRGQGTNPRYRVAG
jgi:hypothetical protein